MITGSGHSASETSTMEVMKLSMILAAFLISTTGLASSLEANLTEARELISETSKWGFRFDTLLEKTNGVLILQESSPFAAMRFNLQTRQIEIFQNAKNLSPQLLASALVHEARHAVVDQHAKCVRPAALVGKEVCDEELPELSNWHEGGSYVYELYFQKTVIDHKIPGHEKYVRQFVGNIHTRFVKLNEDRKLDEWIGPELLEQQSSFIQSLRSYLRTLK